jgi:hypothetical protein
VTPYGADRGDRRVYLTREERDDLQSVLRYILGVGPKPTITPRRRDVLAYVLRKLWRPT